MVYCQVLPCSISYSLIDMRNYSKNITIIIIYNFYQINNDMECNCISWSIVIFMLCLCKYSVNWRSLTVLIYAVSTLLFVLVFVCGYLIIRTRPTWAEKSSVMLSALGFVCQIGINWIFCGNGRIYNPYALSVTTEKSMILFLFLCLVSIFCYSALLMVFYKAYEFYHE